MPTLNLKINEKTLEKYPLEKGISLSIGRREGNDVVIADQAVSGHHAKIDSLGDRFVLVDLQSKNGSFVNEQLVNSHWLKHGDVITIGGYSLSFSYPQEEHGDDQGSDEFDQTQAMNSTQHRQMLKRSNATKSINVAGFWDKSPNRGTVRDIDPAAPPHQAADKKDESVPALIYLAGGDGHVKLNREITTIGKDTSSDVVVTGLLVDPTAFTIHKKSDGCYLNYIGGLSKPKVNDEPVKESTLLNDLDIIEIGSAKLQFSSTAPRD